jgi:hypothetical protein
VGFRARRVLGTRHDDRRHAAAAQAQLRRRAGARGHSAAGRAAGVGRTATRDNDDRGRAGDRPGPGAPGHDDGAAPESLGYAYKVHIALPSANRSVEAVATLIAANGSALFSFTARLHGAEGYPVPSWPSWNNSDSGLNEFTGDGATPTGLAEFDLNSPETNASEFGPFPINRAVRGLKGNWAVLSVNNASTLRSGILLHTGEWPGWAPPSPMPNSLGCIHAWPDSIERVWKMLVALGVEVRPNNNGALPYPYKPQGLLSVECPACVGRRRLQ